MKLTDIGIRQLPTPERGQKTYWERGFGVRVSQGGSKSFVCKHQGKLHTIGRYPNISLREARRAAIRLQAQEYPKQRSQRLSASLTAYLEECEAKNRPKTVEQYRHYLSQVQKERLENVQRTDIDLSCPHAVMSWKVFFNWCLRHELVDKNPFAYISAKVNERDRVLSSTEIKAIWHYEHQPYSTYLKLLLLTGQRRGQFQQFTIDGELVTFPAAVMKNKRSHTLPITPTTTELLKRLEPYSGWSKAKARMDQALQLPHWTLHDLRRTHSTLQAQLGTPIHVTEAILSHVSGAVSGVARIYNRYDYLREAREALERLEAHVQAVVAQGTQP